MSPARTAGPGGDYSKPDASVDVVLLTLRDGALHVGLLPRPAQPHEGELALPGGYVHVDEDRTLADTALRMLRDKTGLAPRYLEQLRTFGGADRDPRGWSVSIAYYVLLDDAEMRKSTGKLKVVPVSQAVGMPFDHDSIVVEAVSRLRGKSTYSTLPAYLLPATFTLGELQTVYEQVMETSLDKVSFRRKVNELGILEAAEGRRQDGRMRPAQLFRLVEGAKPTFDRRI